jgi:hypothetical protein
MAEYTVDHPPRFCHVCGRPLVMTEFEKQPTGYDVMTGKKMRSEVIQKLSCEDDPDGVFHSLFFRDTYEGKLSRYWIGS